MQHWLRVLGVIQQNMWVLSRRKMVLAIINSLCTGVLVWRTRTCFRDYKSHILHHNLSDKGTLSTPYALIYVSSFCWRSCYIHGSSHVPCMWFETTTNNELHPFLLRWLENKNLVCQPSWEVCCRLCDFMGKLSNKPLHLPLYWLNRHASKAFHEQR